MMKGTIRNTHGEKALQQREEQWPQYGTSLAHSKNRKTDIIRSNYNGIKVIGGEYRQNR